MKEFYSKICKKLKIGFGPNHVVANNGPHSIGGGGTPMKPNKPPICV